MRLKHHATQVYEGNAYHYFQTRTRAGDHELNQGEYDWLSKQTRRLQSMVDRALGPDMGMIYTTDLGRSRTMILRVADTTSSDPVRSLIGWIELFALEEEEAHREIMPQYFPRGNPGFAP
jgi:hypothetical protein